MNRLLIIPAACIVIMCASGCRSNQKKNYMDAGEKGTYGYDLAFLGKYAQPLELKEGKSRVLVLAEYQGRVMTSSSDGEEGMSYGWINHDLIASGKVLDKMNPYGGEERFWLGPEGGQYSIFFAENSSFEYANWQTPACIDTEPFELTARTESGAEFSKKISLRNYSGFLFDLDVRRIINIMTPDEISAELGTDIPEGIGSVAYKTVNSITNTGESEWRKETGLLSIWLLGMFIPSPDVTVVIPYETGGLSDYIVKDDYFGKVPPDRLKVDNGFIFFKCDGKYRSKIGVPPGRAKSYLGSFDRRNNVLTIVRFSLPEDETCYVNSAWELQEKPYSGDVVNSYNDGPLEDGSQMGPFYELETSSPAAALKPGESLVHTQQTFHFQGDIKSLGKITMEVFGLTPDEF